MLKSSFTDCIDNGIFGIILAAGEGKRAGGGKLSRIINGRPMLLHVVETVTNSNLDSTILVTGYERELGENIAKHYAIKTYYNQDYSEGMSTSLKLGVSKLPENITAFMVFLGDMPYLHTKTVDAILELYKATKADIIIPIYNARQGHPVLFSCKYKQDILNITGDIGARDIIKKHSNEVKYITVADEGVVKDVDF